MSMEREFEGKDLEEALGAASESLGIPEPDLDYEILEQGRRGLMGLGAKNVRIRVMPPVGVGEKEGGGGRRERRRPPRKAGRGRGRRSGRQGNRPGKRQKARMPAGPLTSEGEDLQAKPEELEEPAKGGEEGIATEETAAYEATEGSTEEPEAEEIKAGTETAPPSEEEERPESRPPEPAEDSTAEEDVGMEMEEGETPGNVESSESTSHEEDNSR